MSFVIQGWCPGALKPMMSGDGLVLRIRPRMAQLTAAQAQGIAKASMTHGNGLLDLTARANVQLRGIRAEAHLALLDDLAALGLIDPTEAVETHRNLTIAPFWTGPPGPALAEAVTTRLTAPENAALPGKFGVSLDLDRDMVLQTTASDIRVEWHSSGWLIRPDGFDLGATVQDIPQALTAIQRLIDWFLAAKARRMADLAGQTLPHGFDQGMTKLTFRATPGRHALGHLVGLEFGQLRAETLAALANNNLRITPWRMILIQGPVPDLPDLPDLITEPADPRLNVVACTGAPGCPQALQPTRDLARSLAPQVPQGQTLQVSGCAKGCAHPGPADLTLCATQTGFDLIRTGRASDTATHAFDLLSKAL